MTIDLSKLRVGDHVLVRLKVRELGSKGVWCDTPFKDVAGKYGALKCGCEVVAHEPGLVAKPRRWRWGNKTPADFWPVNEAPQGLEPGDDLEVMFHGGTTARGNLTQALNWQCVIAYRVHPRSDGSEAVQLGAEGEACSTGTNP